VAACVLAALQTTGCASAPAGDAAGAPLPSRVITDVLTVEDASTVAAVIRSTQALTYAATTQESPYGVLFQFPDTGIDGLGALYYPPRNPVIRAIRTTPSANTAREARIFFELVQALPYEVVPEANGLKIVFRKPAGAVTTGSQTAPPAQRAAAAAGPSAATLVREVSVSVLVDAAVIRVAADGAIRDMRVFTIERPARIVFDLLGLRSAHPAEQRVPVESRWVRQVRYFGHPDKVRLVAETIEPYLGAYFSEPAPDGLIITVGRPPPGK
jgi:hypothetical protein